MLIANGNYLRTAQTLDTGFTSFEPHRLNGDGLAAYTGWAGVRRQSAVPVGYGMSGFVPPITGGDLCGRVFSNTITATANGLMGVPITGVIALSITPASLDGQLIAWGTGTCTITMQPGSIKLEANVKGAGSSAITFSATANILPLDDSPPARTGHSQLELVCDADAYPLDDSPPSRSGEALIGMLTTALLGAVLDADGSAQVSIYGEATPRPLNMEIQLYTATGTIHLNVPVVNILPVNDSPPARNATSTLTVTGTAAMLPLDDSPPARTAFAGMSFSGNLDPYALGHMVGSALPYTELSPQALADAVWSCQAEAFTVTGTMGKKINDGGAGGLTTEQENWLQQAAEESSSARKASVNKAIITVTAEGGQRITIYEDDGVTPIFSFDLSLDGTTRTPL